MSRLTQRVKLAVSASQSALDAMCEARDRWKQLLDADEQTLTDSYKHWVDDYIQEGTKREKDRTEAVAAGSVEFVEGIKAKLGVKTKYRQVNNKTAGAAYALQEPTAPYKANFDGKMFTLRNTAPGSPATAGFLWRSF